VSPSTSWRARAGVERGSAALPALEGRPKLARLAGAGCGRSKGAPPCSTPSRSISPPSLSSPHTTIAGFTVTRASLFGFAVEGPTCTHVLELDEAALILARAARLAASAPVAPTPRGTGAHFKTCDWIGCPGCKNIEPPADLLEAPRETFPGHFSETWKRGNAATARVSRLRRALGRSVNTHAFERSAKFTAELGAERVTVQAIEITYASPRGVRVPALCSEEGR
jgi:hypothetical protein